MRAAVLRGGRIGVERLPDPQPVAGQLPIAPHAAGICGSDLHLRESLSGLAQLMPDADEVAIVPGHEFAGEVVALGTGTDTRLSPGEPVTAIPFSDGAAGVETIGISPTHSGGLAELALDPLGLTMAEATVEVSFAYRPHEFRAAALLLQEHPERFGSMITSVRSLEETAAAFDALAHEPEELKILIRPQAG